ncbi:hypothetical protein BDZ89DRAFT_1121518 [Hymenopellis radicata]|nr:hypothetical protein BDZ89DRAFT_1121518 [Hymenopellis radicata]
MYIDSKVAELVRLIRSVLTLDHDHHHLQNSNEAVRLEDRLLFFETVPFGTYEYRVIPLKENVTLYAKDPVNQTITPLDACSLTLSSAIHPFFLVAYVNSVIQQYPPTLNRDLRRLLVQICIHWAVQPCLEFVQGSYEGEFWRGLSFRYMKRRYPIPPVPSLTHTPSACTSASSACSLDSDCSFKRLRSSSPATVVTDEAVDIRIWVAKCDPNDFDPVVNNDADVGSYRLEAVASLEDAIKAKENTPLTKIVSTPQRRNPKRKRA